MATIVGKNSRGGIAKVGKNTKTSSYTDFSGNTVLPTSNKQSNASQSIIDLSRGLAPDESDVTQAQAGKMSTKDLSIALANQYNRKIGGGAPTVFTNANKVEKVIPLLDSKATNLQGTGFNAGDSGTYGDTSEQDSFDDILGISGKKKKKKKEDALGQIASEDPLVGAQFQLLDQLAQTQDKATQEYIRRTRQSYDQRQQQQEAANASSLAQVKQALNLGGSSRYAPISSAGIISMKEQQGIQALAKLDADENQLIAEIKQAQQDKDFETLEKKLSLVETVRREKNEKAAELEETVRETERQTTRDNAIADLVMQGITNPVEMLNYLNFSDNGERVGDFTLSEITSALKGLNELSGGIGGTGFKLDNKQIGQLLGAGLTTDDIKNMQKDLAAGGSLEDILSSNAWTTPEEVAAVKKAFGVENVKPGRTIDEEVKVQRTFAKVAPMLNKGALSDTDAERIYGFIDAGFASGMSEQQLLNEVAGLPPELNTPYNGTFRDIIVSNSDTTDKQTQNMGRLSQQLSAGNYQSAMNTVENLAMGEAKKLDPDNYIGNGAARFALTVSNDLRKLVDDAEDVLGPLEGTLETIKGKLAKSKDPRASKISAEITKLTAPMRNQLSGTAVTASETSFLEPLIPSLSDTVDNIYIKIDSLDSQTLDRLNSTRSMVSLPEVTKEMVIDPKKRLILYSNDIYYNPDGDLDL